MFKVVIYRFEGRVDAGTSGFTNSFTFSDDLVHEALDFIGCTSCRERPVKRVDMCRAFLTIFIDPRFRTLRPSDLCIAEDDVIAYNLLRYTLTRIRDSFDPEHHLNICSIVHLGESSDCPDSSDSFVPRPSVDA